MTVKELADILKQKQKRSWDLVQADKDPEKDLEVIRLRKILDEHLPFLRSLSEGGPEINEI
jgi:hypothetical protein